MSEQILECLREHNKMIIRVEDIEEYLDGVNDKRIFTRYEVQKIIKYIRLGGGWI